MRTDSFPLNYFTNIFTPKRAFFNRHAIGWPTIVIVLIFLNALITIPVSLNFAQTDTIGVEQFYPEAFNLIDGEAAEGLSKIPVEEGRLLVEQSTLQTKTDGLVLIDQSDNPLIDSDVAVAFGPTEFTIREHAQPELKVRYTKDFSVESASVEEVKTELNRQWRVNNRVYIVAALTFLISFMTFTMLVVLTLGSALFLYFTKKSHLTSITTYKESVAIILYGLGLPTILALLYGLIQFDIIWMMTIQTTGLLIMLVLIYFKTQFNDKKDQSRVQEWTD
ncbi:DUF1189 family protein [Marinilactibacillus sp. XAAS-LB27]|uniref:DUF1189 family protein n=1 Tax=Marinilactibacillus sp. XAAS-LB27 TaxID=3114538 RepID=UPI002E16D6B7|nr:DUF1189 family protein [Marinilactibacillus sp. XAAS-LB27]